MSPRHKLEIKASGMVGSFLADSMLLRIFFLGFETMKLQVDF